MMTHDPLDRREPEMSSMSNVDTPWGLPSDIVVTHGDFSPDMWKPHSPAHRRNSVDTPWGLPPDIVLNQYSRITTQLKSADLVIQLEWKVTVSERKERRHHSIEHRPIRLPGVGWGGGEDGMESARHGASAQTKRKGGTPLASAAA